MRKGSQVIDWHSIDREEEAAFRAYARLIDMSPDELAQRKLADLETAQNRLHETFLAVGGKPLSRLSIDKGLSPLAALIALSRRAIKDDLIAAGTRLTSHIEKYGGLYHLNWGQVTKAARIAGVDTAQTDWLIQYLQKIPAIRPFSPNLDAFVCLFPAEAPRVVISANLHNLVEIALVPIVLNTLSDDGKSVPLKRRPITPELLIVAGDALVRAARAYSHRDVMALNIYMAPASTVKWILARTEIVSTIGTIMTMAANDFVLYHELAHVALGHSGKDRKRCELEADNLAFNCLLERYREYGHGDDILPCFAAAGVMLLLYFFRVLEVLDGNKNSDTHPPITFRRAALSFAILGGIVDQSLPDYQGLNQTMCLITEAAMRQLEKEGYQIGVGELQDMDQFQLAIIPSDELPHLLTIGKTA